MKPSSPRGWPYTASSSPEPLPTSAWVQSLSTLHPLTYDSLPTGEKASSEEIRAWMGKCRVIGEEGDIGCLDEWLSTNNKTPLSERRLFLAIGELANPYRLSDLGISGIPLIPVRIDGVARTWTDTMDSREVKPGIHHVTLARTKGWWEQTFLAFPDMDQLRKMTAWINDGGAAWRWMKLDEGSIHLCSESELNPPEQSMLHYDGQLEWIEENPPLQSGPSIDISEVTVMLHTKQGIYNHRGRIARCVHYPQRTFHNDVFRRGSAKRWNDVISTQ